MKRLVSLLVCVILAFYCLSFISTAAEEPPHPDQTVITPGWGTEEDGLKPGEPAHDYYRYHIPYTETDRFPNADFEKGLMYWTHCRGLIPSQSVKLVKDEGNTAIQFTPQKEYDGIFSVPFIDSRVKVDDKLVVVYKWKGTGNIQIGLEQIFKNKDRPDNYVSNVRLSHTGQTGIQTLLYLSTDESKWNVSMSNLERPVTAPTTTDSTIYLSLFAQVWTDTTDQTIVDDLTLARYNDVSRKVYDLDGNELYDLNDLEEDEVEDEIDEDQFDNIDFEEEKKPQKADKKEETKEVSFFIRYLPWIITGILAVIAAAIIMLMMKKREK